MEAATYAVVACSACNEAWAIEARHASASCPRCNTRADLERRRRLWEGNSPREAQAMAAVHRASLATGKPAEQAAVQIAALRDQRPVPRHDSPVDAAAARAVGIINKSARAEAVALWMTRLVGDHLHADLVQAMVHAGLDRERAEAEVTRMLACDILFEPRAGSYRVLNAA